MMLCCLGCSENTIAEFVTESDGGVTASVDGRTFESDESYAVFKRAEDPNGLSTLEIGGAIGIVPSTDETITISFLYRGDELPEVGAYTYNPLTDCFTTDDVCLLGTYVQYDDEDVSNVEVIYTIYEEYAESTVNVIVEAYYDGENGPAMRGTFSMVLFEDDQGGRLTITEGEFDVRIGEI